jgi:hypothetical protein
MQYSRVKKVANIEKKALTVEWGLDHLCFNFPTKQLLTWPESEPFSKPACQKYISFS